MNMPLLNLLYEPVFALAHPARDGVCGHVFIDQIPTMGCSLVLQAHSRCLIGASCVHVSLAQHRGQWLCLLDSSVQAKAFEE
jgi:hypothetical protein